MYLIKAACHGYKNSKHALMSVLEEVHAKLLRDICEVLTEDLQYDEKTLGLIYFALLPLFLASPACGPPIMKSPTEASFHTTHPMSLPKRYSNYAYKFDVPL